MFATTQRVSRDSAGVTFPEHRDRVGQAAESGQGSHRNGARGFANIVGRNRRLRQTLELAERVAATAVPVLICGETGTGKELVAQGIHSISSRREGPFVAVNCGAIPESIAEAELFGYERGAFTGAVEARAGHFELAHGGTLFLDEVGELSLELQVKLLRALQEKEIRRVGGTKHRVVDVRIVAATNRDLQHALRQGLLREDLYYRIATIELSLPALRERSDDIPTLAAHLLARACEEFGKPGLSFTPEAIDILCRHTWPGNVRELRNVVERAVLLAESSPIGAEQLPSLTRKSRRPELPSSLRAGLRVEKRQRVEAALRQTQGNRTAAARLLCMSRSNLNRLMHSLGISLAPLHGPFDGPTQT